MAQRSAEITSAGSQSQRLLRQVARRIRVVSFGSRFCRAFLVCAGLYGTGILLTRLTGIFPEWFMPRTLAAIPLLAALFGLFRHHRPSLEEAAHVLDQKCGTRDLFLTMTLVDRSAGDFQPLVIQAAESQAPRIHAPAVIPYRGTRGGLWILATGVLVSSLQAVVPQWDPFQRLEVANSKTLRRQLLSESRQKTELRARELTSDESDRRFSAETIREVEALKSALQQMQPQRMSENFQQLSARQQAIDDLRERIASEMLPGLTTPPSESEQLGTGRRSAQEKWTQALREGDTEGPRETLEEIENDLHELADQNDPVASMELEREIRKELTELKSFASERIGAKPLAEALEQALDQMELASEVGMKQEALKAAAETIRLAGLELEDLARAAEDLKTLEEASQVVQQARRLNRDEQLDGDQIQSSETLAAIAANFSDRLEQMGTGGESEAGESNGKVAAAAQDGTGSGGGGSGQSDAAPPESISPARYYAEQTRSAVAAGKALMTVNTRELSEAGDAKAKYRELLRKVRQGSSAAMAQEEIPPAYHDGIRNYFSRLKEAAPVDAGK